MERVLSRVETPLVLAIATGVTLAAVLATAPHGPGISPDSALYLSVGRKLADGQGLVGYGNEALVAFPPGFPLLLAALDLPPGTDLVTGARVVNALLLGLLIGASWLLLGRLVGSPALRLAAVLFMAASPTVHRIGTFAWSEPLFILVSLGALAALEAALRRPGSRAWLVAAALATSAAFFVRYVALVLVPLGIAALVLAGRDRRSARERSLRAGAFALIALAGPAAWIARNLSLSSTPLGERDPTGASVTDILRDAGRAMAGLVAPLDLPRAVRVLLALLVAAVLIGALAARRRAGLPRRPLAWLLGGFAALHLLALLIAATATDIDWGDDRLLAPVLVPAAIASAAMVDAALAERRRGRDRSSSPLLTAGAVLLIAAGLAWSTAKWWGELSDGVGYAAPRWRQSELVKTVKGTSLPAVAYSNAPDGLFHLTGVDARCWPDELSPAGCSGTPAEPAALERRSAALVWFSPDTGGRRTSPRPARGLAVVGKVNLNDGVIYLLRRRKRQ